MRICSVLLALTLMLACPFYAKGEAYVYKKGAAVFSVRETPEDYRVTCVSSGTALQSRNRNITDRQNRMTAIDLIGAYIIFTSSEHYSSLGAGYFPYVVDGIDLHYNAVVEGLRQETVQTGGKPAQEYICKKEDYRIDYAVYKKDVDLYDLIRQGYEKDKCGTTAALLYDFKDFASDAYLLLERDYLTGNTRLPSAVRQLQAVPDRFELSVYFPDYQIAHNPKQVRKECTDTKPYRQFYYEEYVTSAPLKDKTEYYSLWNRTLSDTGTVYESMLLFCSLKCRADEISSDEATFSQVIETYPGAVSPFGIRRPINDSLYLAAAAAYAESDFGRAADLLRQSIDSEGISVETLNLIGASYRYLGQPEKAMPYLLLCLKLDPNTEFLAGNIAMCMNDMGFDRMDALCRFLLGHTVEEWSKKEINKL